MIVFLQTTGSIFFGKGRFRGGGIERSGLEVASSGFPQSHHTKILLFDTILRHPFLTEQNLSLLEMPLTPTCTKLRVLSRQKTHVKIQKRLYFLAK